jgi:hypothetical protein
MRLDRIKFATEVFAPVGLAFGVICLLLDVVYIHPVVLSWQYQIVHAKVATSFNFATILYNSWVVEQPASAAGRNEYAVGESTHRNERNKIKLWATDHRNQIRRNLHKNRARRPAPAAIKRRRLRPNRPPARKNSRRFATVSPDVKNGGLFFVSGGSVIHFGRN